jgi:hypothetical protein
MIVPVLSGIDGPVPGVYHPLQSIAEVKARVELYPYSFFSTFMEC